MNSEDEAIYRLVAATNQLDGSYYFYARRLGEKENALALLYALSDGEPHSQKQVSQEWLIPKTTVNTIIKEWEKQGYAALGEGPGREKAIELTPAGQAYAATLLDPVWAAERSAMAATLERFPAQFVDAFEFFTARLAQELQARAPSPSGRKEEHGNGL